MTDLDSDIKLTATMIVTAFVFLQILNSGNTMTTEDIVQRIICHRLEFEDRNSRKEQKELAITKSLEKIQFKQNGDCQIKNNSN